VPFVRRANSCRFRRVVLLPEMLTKFLSCNCLIFQYFHRYVNSVDVKTFNVFESSFSFSAFVLFFNLFCYLKNIAIDAI